MKVGDFTFQIVDAESKQLLKGFCALDGRVFIETSPDVEYLFRIQVERLGNTYYTYNIDGVNIGYTNICQEADVGMPTIQ